ncbi:MAG: (2Fe-2S) ferredoxin domain-containing protein [Rhodospirillaceae bacterium]|nr:(2Fe-2S) ferredoxin domain-containing protein [Rhodospirillaceae bacterium]
MTSKKPSQSKLPTIFVCTNFRSGVHSSCAARGSKDIFKQLKKLAKEKSGDIVVEQIVCLGRCEEGPNVRIAGQKIINSVGIDDLPSILDALLAAGNK